MSNNGKLLSFAIFLLFINIILLGAIGFKPENPVFLPKDAVTGLVFFTFVFAWGFITGVGGRAKP